MCYISPLRSCGCLSHGSVEPHDIFRSEPRSYCEQIQEIISVAARIFTTIAAGATALIFLASGNLLAGVSSLGLIGLTVALCSSSPEIEMVPLQRQQPSFGYAPPITYARPRPTYSFAPQFHFPSFDEDRIPVGRPMPTIPTFAPPPPRTLYGPAMRAPLIGIPPEERVQVGDHGSLAADPENERVPTGRR